MYVLCLFVVLAALFITVLNSRTAHTVKFGENSITDYPASHAPNSVTSLPDSTEAMKLVSSAHKKEKSHSVLVNW